mmetsp:Transcript_22211/g.41656  ORF Transcript_22211/g.41656 Transcript_22211/m.41656 type:complete len:641 (+) Transcript_22211:286-2208(+)
MDPQVRLQEDEVVQLEGWMLKRKATEDEYADDADDDPFGFLPTHIPHNGNKLEDLILRKTERKRYFVLTTQRPNMYSPGSARLTYYTKKVRFVRPARDKKADPQRPLDYTFAKGFIELDENVDVSLYDGGLRIVIPGKSYFVRPLPRKGAKAVTENKLRTGEWYMALQRAIKDAWEMKRRPQKQGSSKTLLPEEKIPKNFQGILASKRYRKNFRLFCEFSHAAENLDFYEAIEEYENKYMRLKASQPRSSRRKSLNRRVSGAFQAMAGRGSIQPSKDIIDFGRNIVEKWVREGGTQQVNLSDQARSQIIDRVAKQGNHAFKENLFQRAKLEILELMEANFFMKFYREEEKKTRCFSKLFGQHQMRGYELVLGHFGKVKTDLDRLIHLYELRLEQLREQLSVFRNALHISHDIAVSSCTTTCESMLSLYRGNAVQIQITNELIHQLTEHVTFPILWLRRSLDQQLEAVISHVGKKREHVENVKAVLELARRKDQDLRTLSNLSPSEPLFAEMLAERKIAPGDLALELKTASTAIAPAESAVLRAQKDLDDVIIDSLDKLESLELNRLTNQQRAIMHAAEAEKAYVKSIQIEHEKMAQATRNISPATDLVSFASYFKEQLVTNNSGWSDNMSTSLQRGSSNT